MTDPQTTPFWQRKSVLLGIGLAVAAGAAGTTALLMNIFERKVEQRRPYVQLVQVTEDDTDPAKWGKNWPAQYDTYRKTAITTRTRFGGHGGSEALPAEKIERDPWLKRMFLGYAFSIDYRDRRGHAPLRVRGQCADEHRGGAHEHQRRHQYAPTADPVAEVAEHDAAERPRHERHRVRREREQGAGERVERREEELAEDQGRGRGVEEEVVPLQ